MKSRFISAILGLLLSSSLSAQIASGLDFALSHRLTPRISANLDINLISLKYVDESEAQNHLTFAPNFSSIGRITYQLNKRLTTSFDFQLLREPTADQPTSSVDHGYFVTNTSLAYAEGKFKLQLSLGQALPVMWHEEQFDIDYEVFDEPEFGGPLPINRIRIEARLSLTLSL